MTAEIIHFPVRDLATTERAAFANERAQFFEAQALIESTVSDESVAGVEKMMKLALYGQTEAADWAEGEMYWKFRCKVIRSAG